MDIPSVMRTHAATGADGSLLAAQPPPAVVPNSALDSYLAAAGESEHIDAKAPMAWDGGVKSAALAKDIASFANSRDGGVIVVGKSETGSGAFDLVGLTEEEARSFDTTKVAKWINNRFAPPIKVVCHRRDVDGKRFVIVAVAEFDDIPALCIKSFEDPANPKRPLLRRHTVYVRNSNAESAPLESVEELRALIGLATAKRAHQMLGMFDSMLKGKPLVPVQTNAEQFGEELEEIENGLGSAYSDQLKRGAWRLIVRPERFDRERWADTDLLESIVAKRAVRLMDTFPAYERETHPREWGICNDLYGDIWTLARSGQFVCVRPYRENEIPYKCSWVPPDPDIEPGKWKEFRFSIISIFEMFLFAARLTEEYDVGEQVQFTLQGTGLAGRRLLTLSLRIHMLRSDECRANLFEFTKSVTREEFQAEWESNCAVAMKRFVDLFPGQRPDLRVMEEWVAKFKERKGIW